jgi:DNA modification methylase
MTLHCGDSFAYLQTLPDNSVDAVVTDPPYGLGTPPDPATVLAAWLDTGHHEVKGGGFMGKAWDAFVPQPAFWKEVYRVLKPGGHVAAFFGTRTYDWGAVAIRLAGFEIRGSLVWTFGSGFPKGCNISKAIDSEAGADREVVGINTSAVRNKNRDTTWTGDVWGDNGSVITAPATDAAREWEGWNTQLKPAHEPICLARKPCSEPTVAANVLKWRTGALNIGACRVGTDTVKTQGGQKFPGVYGTFADATESHHEGRYPATLIHDGSDAVTAEFPTSKSSDAGGPIFRRTESSAIHAGAGMNVPGKYQCERHGFIDEGSAARYFTSAPYEPGELDSLVPFLYCAKASTSERNAGLTNDPQYGRTRNDGIGMKPIADPRRNFHPTCKPIRLMEWLCNLLCPPGGLILDPFMGSGTTGIAAGRNGFDFIGCELDPGYFELCPQRIAHWTHYRPELQKVSNPQPLETTNTPTLF